MNAEFTLQELYADHLKDMYSAEIQITQIIPNIIKAVNSAELKKALEQHLQQTENHVARLEYICKQLGLSPRGEKCLGMGELLEEYKRVLAEPRLSPDVLTAALIGCCQNVEEYEIRSYNFLRDMAEVLGETQALELLIQSLEEEEAAEQTLSQLEENLPNLVSVPAIPSAVPA